MQSSGEITAGIKPGRTSDEEIIVCDLTGVGVQDVAAASLVLEALPKPRAIRRKNFVALASRRLS